MQLLEILTKVFTPELVDAAVAKHGRGELRRRLLPARVVVYFVLALCLFARESYRGGDKPADQRHTRQPGPGPGQPLVAVPGAYPARGRGTGGGVPAGGRPAGGRGDAGRLVARPATPGPGRHAV
ncbi:transposase domain-containing protein [Streptomyces goshikiensis]|uniref:transposase domain-containing protein n=1 Tax=Streptomyces goshikiensis TaxID=1942 RepID=UPI0036896D7D